MQKYSCISEKLRFFAVFVLGRFILTHPVDNILCKMLQPTRGYVQTPECGS